MVEQKSKKVKRFWLGNIRKEFKKALDAIGRQVDTPFPKSSDRWLSHYEYRERRIHFNKDGTIKGGLIRLLFVLIDFSFIRNVVAPCYSFYGGNCYDPVTLFLLELLKLLEGYNDYSRFEEDLKDPTKGLRYRELTGIKDRIPDQVDMYNFRARIGEEVFQEIMGLLVELLKIVGIVSGQIITTDGTLLEAFARFRGCNYMKKCCECMECPNGIFGDLNEQIKIAIGQMEKEDKISKMVTVEMQCPRLDVIEEMKKALKRKKKKISPDKIGVFTILKLKVTRNPIEGWENHLKYLIDTLGLSIDIPDSCGIEIITCAVTSDKEGALKYHCSKASRDITARTGYRRCKDNPNKTEPVFGYKAVIMTSVEIELELELPIMVGTGPGNLTESAEFLKLHQRLKEYAPFKTKYHIMDSGYDNEDVYEYVRGEGAIPIIDYNYRREKLTKEALLKRGYDELGRPYAPCKRVCKANGYDSTRETVKYTCLKDCKDCASCEHAVKKYGYTTTMSIKEHPRVTLEIPRSTERFKEIKAIRSSAERTNSYGKEWSGLGGLRLWGINSYQARVILVCITILLKRITEFIAKMTLYYKNYPLALKKYGPPNKKKIKASA
jgi:hypothetical protein